MLGKFKKPLKEKCPFCKNTLQIRVRYEQSLRKGLEVDIPTEYIACSNSGCYYEREIEIKKRWKRKNNIDDEY